MIDIRFLSGQGFARLVWIVSIILSHTVSVDDPKLTNL